MRAELAGKKETGVIVYIKHILLILTTFLYDLHYTITSL